MSKGYIKHKIASVPDEVCKECSQLWNGECVAYNISHSAAETLHRQPGGLACDEIRLTQIKEAAK